MVATDLVSLNPAEFAAVIALFLPGFVSLRIDRLIHPNRDRPATDSLIEILGYSLLNAGIFSWAILLASRELIDSSPNYFILGALALLVCLLGPAAWPWLLRSAQKWLAERDIVLRPHFNAWDDYFSRKEACWVIIHLSDGSSVGGYFGQKSRASTGSQAGNIYLEEIWQLGSSGDFLKAVPESKGAIFRPGDYLWIEMRKDD